MIKQHGTILYGYKVFSDMFCWKALDNMIPQGKLNRGYGAECFDLEITDYMIKEIRSVFSQARMSIKIPPLVMRKTAEVLKYKPGMSLEPHFDVPYCKDDFYPFVTVVNLNEGYEGGLYFDCEQLPIEGAGSIALAPSSFLHTHSVKPIIGADRYSMLLDITYPEMLNKCTEPHNWVVI